MAKSIKKPTIEQEGELNSVVENKKDYVEVRGRQWGVRWLHNEAIRRVTDLMLNEKEEDRVVCKCAAVLRLDRYFKIKFFYWFLWRWYYYVREYTYGELLPFISLCKKKVQVEEYLMATMLLTGIKDTAMNMTRKEVSRILQEHSTGQRGR